MRVISFWPAATEIVAALGGLGRLIGVTHECDYPPEVRALPQVTHARVPAELTGVPTVEVDAPLIARLRPDIIIGQSVCEVCGVGQTQLAGVVSTLTPTPWVVTLHSHTLLEVMIDIRKIAVALELVDEADELLAGLAYRLRRIRAQGAQRATRPRVLVLERLDPPCVAGRWIPELVEIAGGQDVGSLPGAPSAARSWRELCALAPDIVIVALCASDAPRARRDVSELADRDARALLSRRVEFLDGTACTSRAGPRLVDAADVLARLMVR